MDNDTDLAGMTPDEAKAYVFNFIVTLKQTTGEMERLKPELELWKNRVMLAESKGLFDLKTQAQAEYSRIEAKIIVLADEVRSLASKIEAMKHAMPGLAMNERSIDPDALLASFGMITGETLFPGMAGTEAAFKANQADADLEALKRKLT